MDVTVWHNPRCAKSRGALALLTEHDDRAVIGRPPERVLELLEPPA